MRKRLTTHSTWTSRTLRAPQPVNVDVRKHHSGRTHLYSRRYSQGGLGLFSRHQTKKSPHKARWVYGLKEKTVTYWLQPTVTMLSDPAIGIASNGSPVREAAVSPHAIPVSCVRKCSTRSKSPSPSTSSSSCAYSHCPKKGELWLTLSSSDTPSACNRWCTNSCRNTSSSVSQLRSHTGFVLTRTC